AREDLPADTVLTQRTHVWYDNHRERVLPLEVERYITPYGKGLDLRFAFLPGPPPRPVLAVEPIWPEEDYGYAELAADRSLPLALKPLRPDTRGAAVRSRISGHGHYGPRNCCEWDAKRHFLAVNGIPRFDWTIWTNCGDNPIHPQGGTWQFDRAGWCPGTFVLTRDHDITPWITGDSLCALDYSIEAPDPATGEGDGRYFQAHQLIQYGPLRAPCDLSLEEINPPLARDIANLEAEIAAERAWLISHASKTAALSERLDLLRQLETELVDLVKRPLDEIAEIDLDAIFDRYASVIDDATRVALKQLLEDLKKSVIDLENELASLIDQFGAQADAAVSLATVVAEADGFDPDDPAGYGLGAAETPWVEVPDVSNVKGAFEDGFDPYAAYADAVLATLSGFVQNGQVVARGSFAANVRAWRENQAALEKALLERESVSKAETNAFLKAQIKVTAYVFQYMSTSYWYLDSPVPADLRAEIDGILQIRFGPLADEMKDNLNQWDGPLDLEETQLVETIRAFAGAVSAVSEVLVPYAEVMQTLVHATSRIAVGFVPVVGPTLDLCEAVTGKMFCLPFAKDLSTEERIMSAVGFGAGSVLKAWGAVKNAGVNPGAKVVAQKVLSLREEFALALQASRRTTYKTLRGAVGPITNEFEAQAGLHLMKNEGRALIGAGDDGVRKVLGIPKDSKPNTIIGKAPDYLSATKGNKLALSEVKGGNIDPQDVIDQLTNALDKLKELNLAGDVERVELIIKKGAMMKDDNYKIWNGFLVKILDNKPATPKGFPYFIQVILL
ncbi:MAG: hypothetical protein HUU21_40305, partial [Polyangiaceae bacterium]|nr:hypothetical protein [Polyangiaceae bacterium]